MQGKGEPPIKNTYFCQITKDRYEFDDLGYEISYTPLQRIFANTVSLTNFAIYNQFPNVNYFYDSFQIFVNNQQYVVQIPSNLYSFWNIVDLQNIVQTQLNSQVPVGVWTVTLAGNSNKFTQITNSAFPFRLVYSADPKFSQIYRYLGFSSKFDPSFSSLSLTQLSKYPFSVQVTQNLNVQLKNTSNMMSDIVGCICQIPLDTSIQSGLFWQSPYYQFSRHIISMNNAIPIYNFQIQLLDDNLNPLSLEGQGLSATVVFEEFQLA